MDAVGAADDRGVFELERSFAQHRRKRQKAFPQDRGSCFDLQRLRGVDHVIRGKPVMQPA